MGSRPLDGEPHVGAYLNKAWMAHGRCLAVLALGKAKTRVRVSLLAEPALPGYSPPSGHGGAWGG